jgi:hypothetical protein
MGTDDIGVEVEGLLAYLNTVRKFIRSDIYTKQGPAFRTAMASCKTVMDAIISNPDEQDALLAGIAAQDATVAAIVQAPASKSDITDALDDYLAALALILQPV